MFRRTFATTLLAALSMPLAAQTANDARATADARIQRIVIEDDNARVDELRVRGQAQRIVVKPKNANVRAYEVLTGDGSRDLSPGHGSSRAAAGQRVWPVLAF